MRYLGSQPSTAVTPAPAGTGLEDHWMRLDPKPIQSKDRCFVTVQDLEEDLLRGSEDSMLRSYIAGIPLVRF